MNEKSRMSCSFEPGEENHELTDAQIVKIAGGDIPLTAMPMLYYTCAVDSSHSWPYGYKACPVCGSKEYIKSNAPG